MSVARTIDGISKRWNVISNLTKHLVHHLGWLTADQLADQQIHLLLAGQSRSVITSCSPLDRRRRSVISLPILRQTIKIISGQRRWQCMASRRWGVQTAATHRAETLCGTGQVMITCVCLSIIPPYIIQLLFFISSVSCTCDRVCLCHHHRMRRVWSGVNS